MRYMARYRDFLNRAIRAETGGTVLEWLDFVPRTPDKYDAGDPRQVKLPDREYVALEFLQKTRPDAMERWASFWPSTGNQQNWDAVGRIEIAGESHWLLVEAKANTGELGSHCRASAESMAIIQAALDETRRSLGLHPEHDLTQRYYQYANRLAVLHFCQHEAAPPVRCRLLFVYLMGDQNPYAQLCPRSRAEWQTALAEQYEWIGLDENRARQLGVHSMFLDVVPSIIP